MERPIMSPAPGERLLRFVGDRIGFQLGGAGGGPLPPGWRGVLRTTLGRADLVREEILRSHFQRIPLPGAVWRDIPMTGGAGAARLDLPLVEVGYFKAKAYALDPQGRQHWPEGPDVGVTVQPDLGRTANTIYCAFVRLFGPTKQRTGARDERREAQLKPLDEAGYTVIPPSGKLRDLVREFPHIFGTLGCRILHLLPVNPTPTTYARLGRFGSPYACQDLMAIDPALVEFDRRTTGIDQFCELTRAAHSLGGKVFLDLVINHTGWGATLQEQHPEWFRRQADGAFVSPGAWGVVWQDLVELDQRWPLLWEHLAEAFLVWCRRGVDGFRCDAGYKVPVPAWQYITARVRQEFPDTVFLLEGLGGAWETTEELLTEGGMQWAYSELFQNYSGVQVAGYLDHSLRESRRVGVLVHYSETHDNNRLAGRGRAWSLLRNRLCALASVGGGFGFTCGVEWLATEKIVVHQNAGLRWGNADNLVADLARLNGLLAEHPCFFDGAGLTRLSAPDSPVYALLRASADGKDRVLVLVNTDAEKPRTLELDAQLLGDLALPAVDLLGQLPPRRQASSGTKAVFTLAPAAAYCLAAREQPRGLTGASYRRQRAQAAWAWSMLARRLPIEAIGPADWRALAEHVETRPKAFLAAIDRLDPERSRQDLMGALEAASDQDDLPRVVTWELLDRTRVLLVPCDHWLLVQDTVPFRATLRAAGGASPRHVQSIPVREGHIAGFAPAQFAGDGEVVLERHGLTAEAVAGAVRFLAPDPELQVRAPAAGMVLLANGIGGMARLGVDLGRVRSKYDCLLGANLHPTLPVDRHVLAKRARIWANADGFITPLDGENLMAFEAGPPAQWRFMANAGDGRSVEIVLSADMLAGRNAVVLRVHRPQQPPPIGRDLPAQCDVRLTIRVDLEDRNFHTETHRNPGADHHFGAHCRPLAGRAGFAFTPAADRRLRVTADSGEYHPEPEWSEHIPHPVEQGRGQVAEGDTYSPGWFDIPLAKGATASLIVSAEAEEALETTDFVQRRREQNDAALRRAQVPAGDALGRQLCLAMQQFLVRRGHAKTVVAGYPWFLDWGRDSLICARGLLAAGMIEEVEQLLVAFGGLADHGTLPNALYGDNAANRDTVDAPLWYALAAEETAAVAGAAIYAKVVGPGSRTVHDVLREIANGYCAGTPNGIRADPASGLVWSPAHFTWMDTSFPAATPRQGYAIEIQALWIRLLRQLTRVGPAEKREEWRALADRAQSALSDYFWLPGPGWLVDVLEAGPGQAASEAVAGDALRSNYLLAICLGLLTGERARRGVAAALRYLVVPGALRSLAPLPVSPPLPVHGNDGRLLNQPREPYWGRYEGDEDTRRKPAYHNGTAWTWTFPTFCEALAAAWDFSATAVATARTYLGSADRLLTEGCLGQLPEILDGDAPHTQRGCDAQAWAVTETFRVWKRLNTGAA